MTRTLRFCGQQLGDQVLAMQPRTMTQGQVNVMAGILQPVAAISSDGANLVYGLETRLYVKRNDELLCVAAIAAIQSLAGLRGDLSVLDDGSERVYGHDWYLDKVQPADLPAGAGGRFTDDLRLSFIGERPLVFR